MAFIFGCNFQSSLERSISSDKYFDIYTFAASLNKLRSCNDLIPGTFHVDFMTVICFWVHLSKQFIRIKYPWISVGFVLLIQWTVYVLIKCDKLLYPIRANPIGMPYYFLLYLEKSYFTCCHFGRHQQELIIECFWKLELSCLLPRLN